MKKKCILNCLSVLFVMHSIAQSSNPSCPNGDAESNSFANWATYLGLSTTPQNMNTFNPGFDGNRTGVHAGTGSTSNFTSNVLPPTPLPMLVAGVDHYGGFSIPNQGVYCFRVGNNTLNKHTGSNGEADLLRYTFQITPSNHHFKFRYAVVLQDGGHTGGENPSVTMYMTIGSKIFPLWLHSRDRNLFNSTLHSVIADKSNPYFRKSTVPNSQDIVFKEWQCVEYDLSSYLGETLSFIFMARDCSLNGHFGYAYLDGLCTEWPATAMMTLNTHEFCDNGQPVIMDGSASTGEDRFFVEVAECDAGGNIIPDGAIVSKWHLGYQVPSTFYIDQFFKSFGKSFKCGAYYKVKLAVMNDCAIWNEKSDIIHFKCPPINAGNNIIRCCGEGIANDEPIRLGVSAQPGLTYNWVSYPVGFTSNNAMEEIPPPLTSTAYILTVRDQNGCKTTDSIVVRYYNSGISMNITKPYDGYLACDPHKHLHAEIKNSDCPGEDSYFIKEYPAVPQGLPLWFLFDFTTLGISSIGNGSDYVAPNRTGTVYAVTTNGCATIVKTEPIIHMPSRTPSYLAPNAFTPNGDGLNDEFQIIDYGLDAPLLNQGPAYNASDFVLTIYNRFGTYVIKRITKVDIGRAIDEPLKNGDIKWDGKDSNGNIVPNDTYNYTLLLQYCSQGPFSNVCFPGADYNPCIQWFWFFCTKRLTGCISHVTVVL